MSERKFTSVRAVIRHAVPQGAIIGFTASRLPMIEFECMEIMPCVQFLNDPRVLYGRAVEDSCRVVNRLIEAFYELQFVFALNHYGVPPREIWKALPKKRTGEIAGPIAVTVGNKSIHVYGFIKIYLDKFEIFVNMLRTLDCVDRRYLDMALLKRAFTLRLTGKERYGLRPVAPVIIGELAEANTGRWVVYARVVPRAYLLVDRWLYTTFRSKGIDVIVERVGELWR
jgi:hypothetical protein